MAIEENLKSMSNVLFVAENSLALEKFTFREIKDSLEAVAQLGVVNRDINSDDEEDPRNDMSEAIEHSLEDLSEYMEFHKDDLKELKGDESEYTKIAEDAMTLLENMIYSLYDPEEFNEWFQSLAESTSPFDLGMKLLDLVEKNSDYPMKAEFVKEDGEMDFEKMFKFSKWRSIVEGFATQLLFIETFANGLFGDGKMEKAIELKERIEGILKEWYVEVEEEKEFQLESIRPIIESIQDNNPKKSCDEKALLIQSELEKLENVGDDLFYILVFPTSDGYVYHANLPDQVFTSLNRGQCHVIVYRSRGAKSASQQELKRMETQVTGYKALLRLLTLKLFVTQSQVDKWAQEIENNGFVIALKASTKAAIRSTKTEVLKWGPGWWVYETLLLGLLLPTKYIILAGFK